MFNDVGQLALALQTTFCTSVPAATGTLQVEVHTTTGAVIMFDEGDDWVLTTVADEPGTCIDFSAYVPEPSSEVHMRYEVREVVPCPSEATLGPVLVALS